MAGKGVKIVAEGGGRPANPALRLCNEIQLFDLCELEKCGHKQGMFCTSTELLNSFEAIAEEEESPAAGGFLSDEQLDDEEGADDEYDDTFDDDQFGDEGFEDDQEDV